MLIFFSCIGAKAQDHQRISLATMTESMAFPFTRYSPIHPGLEMGYFLNEKSSLKLVKSTSVQLGWFFHRNIENAFYLKTDWAWNIKIGDLFTADLYSGLGYMHAFYPGEVYQLNSGSGEFEKINQTGRSHLLGNLGLGFTYRNSSQWEPFIRQDLAVETPFANGIPIMVHSFLKIGTHYKISKK